MKKIKYLKIGLLLIPLLFSSCKSTKNNETSSVYSFISIDNASQVSSDEEKNSVSSISSVKDSAKESSILSISSEKVSTESSITSISSKPIDSNSIVKLDNIPENKNNKVVLGNDNAHMNSFVFNGECPDYFRGIYGSNYTKGDYYTGKDEAGNLKITDPGRGFQTCMFEGNLKLEIRLQIGRLHGSSGKIVRNTPVMVVTGYDENGTEIRSYDIENDDIKKDTSLGKQTVKFYMNGTNISYLEFVCTQLPYDSRTYNFGIIGVDMIAWPYALD